MDDKSSNLTNNLSNNLSNDKSSNNNSSSSNDISDVEKTEIVEIHYPKIPDLEFSGILGQGGSGTVYKGRQPFLKRNVAIKILNVNNVMDDDFVDRFHREAQILANLIHPHIVTCFVAGMTSADEHLKASPYLVMEYVSGPSLQAWIHKNKTIDAITALSIIEKIADALAYADKKHIIHRDIKAENILLKPDESQHNNSTQEFVPKLADLGIARSTQPDASNNLTLVGTMIGTPSSMAPEQFNDPDGVDFKVDIYGLGCVLFHMVTGKKPYDGLNLTEMVIQKNAHEPLNPRDINSNVDKSIAQLIMTMMATNKSERPDSYQQLIEKCQFIAKKLDNKNSPTTKKPSKWLMMISVLLLTITIATIMASAYFYYVSEQAKKIVEVKKTYPTQQTSKTKNTQLVETEQLNDSIKTNEPTKNIKKDTKPKQLTTQVSNIELNKPNNVKKVLENRINIQYVDKTKALLSPGEAFSLSVSLQQDAYLYCFFENQEHEIIRFFPNRFSLNPFVSKDSPLVLPHNDEFELNASKQAISERIACFATPSSHLPKEVQGVDFEVMNVQSLEQIKDFFAQDEHVTVNYFFTIKVQLSLIHI